MTVGRLAQRHDIAVSLRSSPYGGVTAVVLIPHALLEWDLPATPDPVRNAAGHVLTPPHYDAQDQDGYSEPLRSALPTGTAGTAVGPYPGLTPGDFATHAPVHAEAGTGAADRALTTRAPDSSWSAPAAPPPVFTEHGGFPQSGPVDEPGMIDGLPRRVPQASLVEELRQEEPTLGSVKLMDWAARGDTARGPVTPPAWTQRAPADGMAVEPGHRTADVGHPPTPLGNALPAHAPGGAVTRPDQVRSIMTALQAGAARARLGTRTTGQVPGTHLDHHINQGRDNGR